MKNITIWCAGGSTSKKWSPKCTHVLIDDNASLNADVVDAIVSKRHFVSYKWVEVISFNYSVIFADFFHIYL